MFNVNKALVFASVLCVFVEGGCPPGWLSHASSCYLFSHDTEEWIGALNICRELGGQLIEIEDADEDNYILSQARNINKSFWIALSDLQLEGTWVWMNSKAQLVQGAYSNWRPGQPDNSGGDENCANLEDSFHMKWNDLSCHTVQNYICERPNEDTDIVG
ncbi:perlucin-like protein [Mercenaria mercenaria]|uniref:perlucin-like protein n=1 Tax=Mercenaria mercenaria TaxID=6596 RepID=UPI00234F073E|nr:perlucin-like protein [Mercenaria mercenaria]